MHNHPIEDILEMLREEFSKLKLHMKPQSVQYHNTTITGWFVKLNPEIDIQRLKKFLVRVKHAVKDPEFALVVKDIFSGANANSSF